MIRRRYELTEAPRVHRWARRVRVVNPTPPSRQREAEQLRRDIPAAINRLAQYGIGTGMAVLDLSRMGLTRVQRTLQDATENTLEVANDEFLQRVRKHLHLLLDH